MASIRYWLRCVQPKRIIMFVLALFIVALLLISMLPGNFMTQSASANPGLLDVGVKFGGVVADGKPISDFRDLPPPKYIGNKRTVTKGQDVGITEVTIKGTVKKVEVEIGLKGNLAKKFVTTWEEREYIFSREIWLMQKYRRIIIAVVEGFEVDFLFPDITWWEEVPGSRETVTDDPEWIEVKGSRDTDDPPGDVVNMSKAIFPQTGTLTLDYSFVDNIIPGTPTGTITHKLFLDGDSITDGTTMDFMALELGPHEVLVELYVIDGQIIPISMPFTLVPPIEVLPLSGSEILFDETKRIEFTVKNNLYTDTKVNLSIDFVPPGWDVHLVATSVSVPALGESTVEVMVRPTIVAFPQLSMNAVVSASSIDGAHGASANLDVEAAFPDNVEIYRLELEGEEVLAVSIPKGTSLTNFRFEDGQILFESEQADTGFALIIPNSLLEESLQAVGPGGDVLQSIEDLFLSSTHQLFFGATSESGTVTISKKDLEILTEIGPTLPSEELSGKVAELSEKVEELSTKIEVLTAENTELRRSIWRNLIIGLIVGLLVGGGIFFAVMRRRKKGEDRP